jgi:AraC-like DNA-binding protein
MLFRSHTPRAPLCDVIEDFRMYENYAGRHRRERILPSGTFELVFNLRDDELRIYSDSSGSPREKCRRYSGALISGPYAGSFMTDTEEEASILGIHMRPGGAFALLGLPAGELANAHVDLRTVWGPSVVGLRERLCAARAPAERFQLLESALIARLAEPSTRHGAVRCALNLLTRSHGRARVRDVAKAVDLSQRRLIEVFTNEVGLTPKLFGRVQRFQRALALARNDAGLDWAELAAACGYFDQSHLIRDFVAFAGMSPADYRRRQSRLDRAGLHRKRNHLPLMD